MEFRMENDRLVELFNYCQSLFPEASIDECIDLSVKVALKTNPGE